MKARWRVIIDFPDRSARGRDCAMGGRDWRYAKIDCRSSSLSEPIIGHGIGGSSGRPLPSCRPVLNVAMNVSAVHRPRPVSMSGVRLAVKLTPHGPANAVFVAAPLHVHGPAGFGGAGMTTSAGWPDKRARHVGLGPLGSELPWRVTVVTPHRADQVGATLDASGRGSNRRRRLRGDGPAEAAGEKYQGRRAEKGSIRELHASSPF